MSLWFQHLPNSPTSGCISIFWSHSQKKSMGFIPLVQAVLLQGRSWKREEDFKVGHFVTHIKSYKYSVEPLAPVPKPKPLDTELLPCSGKFHPINFPTELKIHKDKITKSLVPRPSPENADSWTDFSYKTFASVLLGDVKT